MIRFAYRSFPVQSSRVGGYEPVFRPMIPLRLHGPAGDHELAGLVDTGSDDTLFPDHLLPVLGIEGSMTVVRHGEVDLAILGAGGGYRWSARVGFHAGWRVVLGHGGFLEYFTASLNGRGRHLTLTPNGKALPPAHP